MTFKAMKFRVESPEHSEKIQKVLFDMGYSWSQGNEFANTESKHLWAELDGSLAHDEDDLEFFLSQPEPEYTLKEITSYEFVPVPTQKSEEFIELNGLKYKKSELEEALKLIKPVIEEGK